VVAARALERGAGVDRLRPVRHHRPPEERVQHPEREDRGADDERPRAQHRAGELATTESTLGAHVAMGRVDRWDGIGVEGGIDRVVGAVDDAHYASLTRGLRMAIKTSATKFAIM
jgi:hypothetical protein